MNDRWARKGDRALVVGHSLKSSEKFHRYLGTIVDVLTDPQREPWWPKGWIDSQIVRGFDGYEFYAIPQILIPIRDPDASAEPRQADRKKKERA